LHLLPCFCLKSFQLALSIFLGAPKCNSIKMLCNKNESTNHLSIYLPTYLPTYLPIYLYGAEHYSRSHHLRSHSRTSEHFMKREGSLPHSQQLSTCPHRVTFRTFQINQYIYRNLRTQQMSVLVLLCTSYTTCFGPYRWPSSGGFVTQKNSKAVTVCQRIRCVCMLICKLDINI
jgi:hypothetical protein